MDIDRVRVEWSGPAVVGGGISTHYATAGNGAALSSALYNFFNTCQSLFPSGKITWSFPDSGETIDSATGQPVGAWSGGTFHALTANSPSDAWAAGVGMRVKWQTGVFHNGRRIVGSTFLVPLRSLGYENDGSIVGSLLSVVDGAANTLLSAVPTMGIHSRPHPGAADGGFATISSHSEPDKVSWLRSRRT